MYILKYIKSNGIDVLMKRNLTKFPCEITEEVESKSVISKFSTYLIEYFCGRVPCCFFKQSDHLLLSQNRRRDVMVRMLGSIPNGV